MCGFSNWYVEFNIFCFSFYEDILIDMDVDVIK